MNHQSLCRCLCIPRLETNPVTLDKMYQKRARLGYVLWIFIVGIILEFTKSYSVDMFYFLYNSLNCLSNTYMNTCFSLVIIYRLTFTIFLYHFVLMCINGGRSKFSHLINDFCWPFKILIFAQIFFITCLIANNSFEFIAMISKWISMVLVVVKTIFLNDILFYYFNKKRLARIGGFSLIWNIFAYLIGVSFLAMGMALFIFCFYWYNYLCNDYKVITSVMFILSSLLIIINLFRYQLRVEINQSFVFFFFMSLANYGIIAATPYSSCVNLLNRNFVYSTASLHIDTVSGQIIRFSHLYFHAFLLRK